MGFILPSHHGMVYANAPCFEVLLWKLVLTDQAQLHIMHSVSAGNRLLTVQFAKGFARPELENCCPEI